MNNHKSFAVIIFFALVLAAASATAGKARGGEEGSVIKYSWASQKINEEIWGMAQGDIDKSGTKSIVLLERKRIRVGRLGEKGFEEKFSCGWSTDANAARIDLFDIDGDGKKDAIITAVEEGMPSSLAFKFDTETGRCHEIFSRARWSLRVANLPDSNDSNILKPVIIGQCWSSQKFFTGPVMKLSFKNGKLVEGEKISLPRNTDIYQFEFLPPTDGVERVVRLAGPAAMEVREHRDYRWRKIWRSGEKLGGPANLLPARQRPVFDQISSEYAEFELPPLVIPDPNGTRLLAIKYDLPLKNVVGRTPYIRGASTVIFKSDPALTFVEDARTQDLPGAIVDYFLDNDAQQSLVVMIQDNAGAFEQSQKGMILRFDLLH